MSQKPCPSCGYCPACKRRDVQPPPHWVVPYPPTAPMYVQGTITSNIGWFTPNTGWSA